MSDDLYNDVYDDDYGQESAQQAGGPKALREAYEKEKEARKALEDRLAKIEQKNQTDELATALEGKGVNPKAAKLALSQGVTPDKLDDWLAEWGDVFGVESAAEQSGGGVDETTKQQLQAVSGSPTGTIPVTTGDVAQQLGAIDNEEDFWKMIDANK